ncbi:hypothetical protein SSPO_008930 [Streptomyces antimycoticus]|uniref:Aldehyde dehydrogenase domain-containing protein n=1 Tax=Streptomyces antimycoticus TaxID=68175 RepID=A0A499UB72_9ACTN|nr:hypothetical protein SSPO_008930 [Streptomyces antimycoticus]
MNLPGIETLVKAPFAEGDVFIAGRWCAAEDGRTFPVHDPATAELIREVSAAGPGTLWRRSRRLRRPPPGGGRRPPAVVRRSCTRRSR